MNFMQNKYINETIDKWGNTHTFKEYKAFKLEYNVVFSFPSFLIFWISFNKPLSSGDT